LLLEEAPAEAQALLLAAVVLVVYVQLLLQLEEGAQLKQIYLCHQAQAIQ